jgi:hypothetical protein
MGGWKLNLSVSEEEKVAEFLEEGKGTSGFIKCGDSWVTTR